LSLLVLVLLLLLVVLLWSNNILRAFKGFSAGLLVEPQVVSSRLRFSWSRSLLDSRMLSSRLLTLLFDEDNEDVVLLPLHFLASGRVSITGVAGDSFGEIGTTADDDDEEKEVVDVDVDVVVEEMEEGPAGRGTTEGGPRSCIGTLVALAVQNLPTSMMGSITTGV
jgi:hypothetical protein